MDNEFGLTLVELAIVLAVVGILSSLAIPSLLGMKPGFSVNSALRGVAGDLQLARIMAISTKSKHRVVFRSPSANEYFIQRDTNRNNSWEDASTDRIIKTIELPAGIEFGLPGGVPGPDGAAVDADGVRFGGDNDTVFDNRGRAETGTVYLVPTKDKGSGRRDRVRAVRVRFATTGQVKAYKFSGTTWADF